MSLGVWAVEYSLRQLFLAIDIPHKDHTQYDAAFFEPEETTLCADLHCGTHTP